MCSPRKKNYGICPFLKTMVDLQGLSRVMPKASSAFPGYLLKIWAQDTALRNKVFADSWINGLAGQIARFSHATGWAKSTAIGIMAREGDSALGISWVSQDCFLTVYIQWNLDNSNCRGQPKKVWVKKSYELWVMLSLCFSHVATIASPFHCSIFHFLTKL